MLFFDTPAGRFRILLNGEPTDFDICNAGPAEFRTRGNQAIISTNCYIAVFPTAALAPNDIVSGVLDRDVLYYSGCIAGMDSQLCHFDNCTFELSAPYTDDHEDENGKPFLPYESFSYDPHGFAYRIVDDPSKYTASPLQREIQFFIAWVYAKDAWSSQATVFL